MTEVLGLDEFKISVAALRRLRQQIGVAVHLRTFEVTRAVAGLPASERHPFLRRRAIRWMRHLNAAFPTAGWKITSQPDKIAQIVRGRVAADQIVRLAARREVESVVVTSIPGRRRRRRASARESWFCVRGLVAVQVEGQRVGLQSVEDRFIVLRATSAEDAQRRLRRQWREYAKPYMNILGELVRWRLERVTDVYDICENQLDPNGAEVYSRLRNRRLRRQFVWLGVRRSRSTKVSGPLRREDE